MTQVYKFNSVLADTQIEATCQRATQVLSANEDDFMLPSALDAAFIVDKAVAQFAVTHLGNSNVYNGSADRLDETEGSFLRKYNLPLGRMQATNNV